MNTEQMFQYPQSGISPLQPLPVLLQYRQQLEFQYPQSGISPLQPDFASLTSMQLIMFQYPQSGISPLQPRPRFPCVIGQK